MPPPSNMVTRLQEAIEIRGWGRLDLALGGALSLIALAIRLFRLEDKAVWWDEGWSVWLARHDFASIAAITASDEHPPLHYWFLHLWGGLAGESQFVLRFSSLLFAVLAVALTYRLGLSLSGRRLGFLAALFLALSSFHVWWSQEIKMYTPAVLLCLLSLYLFLRLLRGGGWPTWLGYGLVTTAALHTLYLAAFVVVVENLVLALTLIGKCQWRRKGFIWRWIATQGAMALASLPWLAYFYAHPQSWEPLEPFDAVVFLRLYLTALPLGLTTQVEEHTLFALPFAFLALVGLVALLLAPSGEQNRAGPGLGWRRAGGLLLAACVLVLPLGVYLLSLPQNMPYHPKVTARYLILFLPAYGLVLTGGIDLLWRRTWLLGALAALFVLVSAGYTLQRYLDDRFPNHDLRTLVGFIKSYEQEGDAIILNPDKEWTQFAYHLGGKGGFYGVPFGARMSAEETEGWLEERVGDASRVWLVTTPAAAVSDPLRQVEGWFEAGWQRVGGYRYGGLRLELFSRSGPAPLAVSPEALAIGLGQEQALGSIALLGFERWPKRLRSGDSLYLATYWQAKEEVNVEYRARLILSDAQGRPVLARSPRPLLPEGAADPWPQGTIVRADLSLTIAASVPSGRYRLELEVSHPALPEASHLTIGELEVVNTRRRKVEGGPAQRLKVTFGQVVDLEGYSLHPELVRPGERLTLTLYWRPRAEIDLSYTVFVHLLDADERLWAQTDSPPQGGRYPTSAWSVGEEVVDEHSLELGQGVPPGDYTIALGLYDATTGKRLPLSGDYPWLTPDNRLLIHRVRVAR